MMRNIFYVSKAKSGFDLCFLSSKGKKYLPVFNCFALYLSRPVVLNKRCSHHKEMREGVFKCANASTDL